jgi:hypothetical protein
VLYSTKHPDLARADCGPIFGVSLRARFAEKAKAGTGITKLDLYFNIGSLNAKVVRSDWLGCRWTESSTIGNIKYSSVPGAGHFKAVDFTFAQRPTDMAAAIIDGVKGTANIEDRDLGPVQFDELGPAGGNLSNGGDFDEV